MTNFGEWILRKWYPGWHTSGSVGALANVVARLYGAASPFEALQEKATGPRVGLVQPVTVAEAEALNAALEACREFQEKYQ